MCGITGILNTKSAFDAASIVTMTSILRHRGPDDEGYVAIQNENRKVVPLVGDDSKIDGIHTRNYLSTANIYLGHRRLSIIDVSSAGHQPMTDATEDLWIVYNGEIYNYLELREELSSKGHTFHSKSDTEVLLNAYKEWGFDCLSKFNGMWAFAIYDRKKNILWGARDRFGVKPLYYYNKNEYFAFASEIKALVSLDFVKTGINQSAAFDYLVIGKNNPEECFFSNIEELKPSMAFSIDVTSGKLKKWKYFELQTTTKWEKFDQTKFDGINEKVKDLLFKAVRLRLRSDVAVGSCLSGGMDSSAIVGIVNEYLKKEDIASVGNKQKVITASYTGLSIDESKWAKIVVDATQAQWFQTFPDAHMLLTDLDDLIYYQDVPFGSTSIFAQYCVMREAQKSGIKVLLDGQGGDELFTGYTSYYGKYYGDFIKNGCFGSLWNEIKQKNNTPVNKLLLKIAVNSLLKIPTYNVLPLKLKGEYFRQSRPELKFLNKQFWNLNAQKLGKHQAGYPGSLNTMLVNMMQSNLPELLRYEDRNSMRFSIESRTPFADDKNLIEYVFSLPSVYKIHNGWNKYLLRTATQGVVPDSILKRTDKIGFNTPEYTWLNVIKTELFERMNSAGLEDYIDHKRIEKNWDSILSNQRKSGITSIWRMINFALWKKAFKL